MDTGCYKGEVIPSKLGKVGSEVEGIEGRDGNCTGVSDFAREGDTGFGYRGRGVEDTFGVKGEGGTDGDAYSCDGRVEDRSVHLQ